MIYPMLEYCKNSSYSNCLIELCILNCFLVKYIEQLLEKIDDLKYGSLASVTGRYYAMDRDKRHERIKIAYEGITQGVGEKVATSDLIKVIVIMFITINFI